VKARFVTLSVLATLLLPVVAGVARFKFPSLLLTFSDGHE
jgi:hypothetical protein